MEKTKYIVSRLALIAFGTAVVLAAVRGLIYIAIPMVLKHNRL